MKKRTTGSSDLRTNPVQLNLHRYTNLPLLRTTALAHWNIENLQPFFPPIECLFKSEKLEFVHEYGVKLQNEIHSVYSADKIRISTGPTPIDMHAKKTMILHPFDWMRGEYGTSIGLPTTTEQSQTISKKLQDPNNAAYVGSLISIVLSESGCDHFPKVYGVFSGVSKSHTIDISDDYHDLVEKSWFSQNIGKTFDLKLSDAVKNSSGFAHTRNSKVLLQLGEEVTLENVEELTTESVETEFVELKKVFSEESKMDEDGEDSSQVSMDYIFNIDSCDCDDHDREIIDEEETEESDSFAWATFTNVPIQITVMEKCDGLMYELMESEPDSMKHLAWITQVIFALAFAQRNFGFVHNDLHGNNIMYVKTSKEYLYYSWNGIHYKVPTHGYLIKIIDFERGIASIKLAGMKQSKLFMSDHFSFDNEAAGQYNYGPYYVSKYQEIKPNSSFDLVRFATSIFWDFFPEGPSHAEYSSNPMFCLFVKWLTLEDGSSVLFGKEDPRHDRYHGFDLYKAIARYCKDTAVPRKELMNLKGFYEISSIPPKEHVLLIDT